MIISKVLKPLNNDRGYALFLAVAGLFLLSVIALSATAISLNTIKLSQKESLKQAEYYIAEAGLTERKVEFVDIVEKAYKQTLLDQSAYHSSNMTQYNFDYEFKNKVMNSLNSTPDFINYTIVYNYKDNFDKTTKASVEVLEDSLGPKLVYKIKSEGSVGNTSKTDIYQDYEIEIVDAVYSSRTLTSGHYSIVVQELINSKARFKAENVIQK